MISIATRKVKQAPETTSITPTYAELQDLPRCYLKRLFNRSMQLFAINSNGGFSEGFGFVERFRDCLYKLGYLKLPGMSLETGSVLQRVSLLYLILM